MGSKLSTPWSNDGREAPVAHQESSEVSERLVTEREPDVESPPSFQPTVPLQGHEEYSSSRREISRISEVMTGMYLSVMVGYDLAGGSGGQLMLPPLETGEHETVSMSSRLIVNWTVSFALQQHRQDDPLGAACVRGSVYGLGTEFSVDFEWADQRMLIEMRKWLDLYAFTNDRRSSEVYYCAEDLITSTYIMSSQDGASFFKSAECVGFEELMVYVPAVEKGNSQPSPEGGNLGNACSRRLSTRGPIDPIPKHYVVSCNNTMGVLAPTERADLAIIGVSSQDISMMLASLNLSGLALGAGRKFLMSASILTFIKQIKDSQVTPNLECTDLELVLALCAFWEGDIGIDLLCDLQPLVDHDEMQSHNPDCHWRVLQGLRFLVVCVRSMVNGKCGRLEISDGADITSNLTATELMTPSILQVRGTKEAAILAESLGQALDDLNPLTSVLRKSVVLTTEGLVTVASLDIQEVYSVLHALTGVRRDPSDQDVPVGVIVGKEETKAMGGLMVISFVLGALCMEGTKPHLRFVISQVDSRLFKNIRNSDVPSLSFVSGKYIGADVERTVEEYSEMDYRIGLAAILAVTFLGALLNTGVFHFLYALLLGAVLGEETDGLLFIAGVAPWLLSRARISSGTWLRAAYIVMLGGIEAWAELEVRELRLAIFVVCAVSVGVLIACRVGRSRLIKWGSGCPKRADFFRGRVGGPTPGVGKGVLFAGTRCGDGNDPFVAPYAAGISASDRIACEHAPAVQEPFDLYRWRLFGNETEARAFGTDLSVDPRRGCKTISSSDPGEVPEEGGVREDPVEEGTDRDC